MVQLLLLLLLIGERIRAGVELLSRPFCCPAAVKITVPLLILPIGGRNRLPSGILLLGIKLMVLLLLLVLLLCTLLLLLLFRGLPLLCELVGMIDTSLFNLCG